MAEAVPVVVSVLDMILPFTTSKISRVLNVNKDLPKLAMKVEMLQALNSEVQNKLSTSNAVQLLVKMLQARAEEVKIVWNEIECEVLCKQRENRKRDKVRRLFSPSNNPISYRVRMAKKMKKVESSIEEAYNEPKEIGPILRLFIDHKEDQLTDPLVDESEIVGRQTDVSQLVNELIRSDYKEDFPLLAGQGKTTLVLVVLEFDRELKYFVERICDFVSDELEVERQLEEMMQSLGGTNAETTKRSR